MTIASDARWTEEATRLYSRYQMEIVEACGLCPWATRTRTDDKFRVRVLLQTTNAVEPALRVIDEIVHDPKADVVLLIYPRIGYARLDFERFVAHVREEDAARHPLGNIPYVFAAFHPAAAADVSDAERLIPFLRRTPDPTIQLLRSDVLDAVRGPTPQGTRLMDAASLLDEHFLRAPPIPLRERIARANLSSVQRMGLGEVTQRLDAIERDRIDTYQALSTIDE